MPEATIALPPPASQGVFLTTLAALSGGRTVEKLEDALREAVGACSKAGAKSKITIELTVMPNGLGAGDVPLYKLSAKVKRTLPEVAEPGSSFFADENFNLSRRNPHQEEMKLTTIPGGQGISKADLKAAATGTAAQ